MTKAHHAATTRATATLAASLLLTAALASGCSKKSRRHEAPPADPRPPAPSSPHAPQAPSASPAPPHGTRPNIVFVVSDDQRADSLACMPKLARLLDGGVTFSRTYATTPLCCPGRTTILTGQLAHHHGVLQNGDVEDGDETRTPGAVDFVKNGNEEKIVARWLQQAGYRTGFIGKYLNGYDKMQKRGGLHVPPYWDDWYAFPHAEYYDFELIERPRGGKAERVCYPSSRDGKRHKKACDRGADRVVDGGGEAYSTDVLKEKAIAFVKAAAAERRPFFLYLAPKAPHGPFESPVRYQPRLDRDDFTPEAMARLGQCPLFDWADRPPSVLEADVTDKPPWVQEAKGNLRPDKIDKVRRKQLVSVLAIEDALDELLTTLDALGQRQNTIVVYHGDNGYAWGEHWWIGKNCAYEECARVPLVILDPRSRQANRTEKSFVINADLAPTLADLAGVPIPTDARLDGMSIAHLVRGQPGPGRDELLIECWGNEKKAHPDIHAALRTARYKYVEHYEDDKMTRPRRRGGRVEAELYDLERDPFELDNLAALGAVERRRLGYGEGEVERIIAELSPRLRAAEAR